MHAISANGERAHNRPERPFSQLAGTQVQVPGHYMECVLPSIIQMALDGALTYH